MFSNSKDVSMTKRIKIFSVVLKVLISFTP